MLTVFLDESGHEGGHLCVLAGFMGSVEQWAGYDSEWKKVLGQKRHLHMSELRWNDKHGRTRRLLAKLGPIPHRHGLTPVVATLSHSIYEENTEHNRPIFSLGPWVLVFQKILTSVTRALPRGEMVAFVFERQDQFSPLVLKMWNYLEDNNPEARKRIEGIHFIEKNVSYGTEAADYLAFQIREYFSNPESPKAQMGMSIMGDLEKTKWIGGHYTAAEVKKFCRDITTHTMVDYYKPRRP